MTAIEVSCAVSFEPSSQAPADWLSRVALPDFPYRSVDGQAFTEADGLAHLAYNAVVNGVTDASRLDGWGDLEPGMLVMRVGEFEVNS